MGRYAIKLDKHDGAYSAGDIVRGRVLHEVLEPEETYGITITCTGQSSVEFEIAVESSAHKFKSDETCFHEFVSLVGDGSSEMVRLETGTHSYPFAIQLPPQIPSTLVGDGGKITYTLQVTNSRFGGEETFGSPLVIAGILNLNSVSEASQIRDVRLKKFVCCWCCRSGPIGITLIINKSGFVPGESIRMIGEVYNFSRRRVRGVKVALVKVAHFRTKERTTTNKEEIMSVCLKGLGSGDSRTIHEATDPIPETPPTENGDGCTNIYVVYNLTVDVRISGSSDLSGEIPNIYIGTVPIDESGLPTEVQVLEG